MTIGECYKRFEVIKIIGEGATAKVFLLWDRLLKRFVALKWGKGKELLYKEARLLAKLYHSCFPTLYDYVDGMQYGGFLMEYIQGENLKERLLRIGSYTEEEILQFACMIAEAVDNIHKGEHPCVYGDIKPENILIQQNGTIKIVDLGTVTPLKSKWTPLRGGTPLYAPPDMWQGAPDIRSDIYALGKLMQMLFGLSNKEPGYGVQRVMERCIQVQKEKRYQNMQEFIQAANNIF